MKGNDLTKKLFIILCVFGVLCVVAGSILLGMHFLDNATRTPVQEVEIFGN